MDNYLLLHRNEDVLQLSKDLGFDRTFFLEDYVIVKGENRRKVLDEIRKNKGKIVVYQTSSEEMLRFAVEKTPVDIVMGMESINKKDSVHYIRGGMDQITCKLMKEKGIKYLISFSEIVSSNCKSLRKIMFNLSLCKKYDVEVALSNFCSKKEEMRSAKDLEAFLRSLKKSEKLYK